MALSILSPHPVAVQNPIEMRAMAALPAAGAWDASPTVVACAGFWWCRLFFAYQRGEQASDGSLEWYWQVSPWSSAHADAEAPEWHDGTIYMPGNVTPCQDVHSIVQNEYMEFCSQGAAVETFIGPPIHLAGCVERFRVYCREGNSVGLPGQARVMGVFYTEG